MQNRKTSEDLPRKFGHVEESYIDAFSGQCSSRIAARRTSADDQDTSVLEKAVNAAR